MAVRQELGRERERERKLFRHAIYTSSLFAKFWRSPITLVFGGFCLVSFCFSQGCVVLPIHVAHQDIHVPMPEKFQAQHAKSNSSSSKQLSPSNYLPKYCELLVVNHTYPWWQIRWCWMYVVPNCFRRGKDDIVFLSYPSLRSGGATPYSFYVIGRRSWQAR